MGGEDMYIKIMDVARLLGLVIKHGTEYRTEVEAMCPFCKDDKGYHLSLNTRKNVFRCNMCGKYGGMMHLYAYIHNTTTKEAYDAIVENLSQNGHMPAQNKVSTGISIKNASPLPEKLCHEVRPVGDRDRVYRDFLNMLILSDIHKHNLKKRGLPSEIISANSYKSITFQPEARLEIGRKLFPSRTIFYRRPWG